MRFSSFVKACALALIFVGYAGNASARYMQADPIGLAGGINDFAYADADPLNNSDPFGLWSYNSNDVRGGFDQNGNSLVFNPQRYDPGAASKVLLLTALNLATMGGPVGSAKAVEACFSNSAAQSIANGSRLATQLTNQSARSPFTATGTLTKDAIATSQPVRNLGPGQLNNAAIPSGFGKYTTQTFQSPAGNFQVHFYANPTTKEVFYGLDYKTIFNSLSGVPK